MKTYGLPYQGSKSRIAEWVIDILPPGDVLVDLFAGGCAITHCALLSGKWERIVANDRGDSVEVFMAAIAGEFNGPVMCPTKDEWTKYRSEDMALCLLYSFGNNMTTYLWSPELERVKVPATKMISAGSIWERRKWYRRFCTELVAYLSSAHETTDGLDGIDSLQSITGLERLERLERLADTSVLKNLSGMRGDYRAVPIPEGAVVYADPPYRKKDATSDRFYGAFDFDAFDAWLEEVDFPVYVSEYDAPTGCVEIAQTETHTTLAQKTVASRIERIFVQERFYDQCKPKTLFDFGLDGPEDEEVDA